ncbi:MAG: Major facilitator superfamily 1 [Candidatus Saccharibacteria bacterium]|nr:Major facilitator superfamily 1 [Candidatus Saccharibacteria bacterium]
MNKRYASIVYLKNPALRALLIGDGIVLTATAMLTPIYALYVNKIGGDIFDVGITAAALAIGAGIAAMLGGRFSDSIKNKKKLVAMGYLIIGVGFLSLTLVHDVVGLACVQLVMGLARPVYETAFDALYSIHLDKKREAQEWGAWEGISYFAAAIGALLGSALVAYFSFTTLFIFMAALAFLSALYVAKLPKSLL